MISVVGEEADAVLRSGLTGFGLFEHPEDLREDTVSAICYFHLWSTSHVSVHRWDDRQNVYTWNTKGNLIFLSREKHDWY